MEPWDVTIVGGGVLGTSLAYWLASRYEGRIAVLERERRVAQHTSKRNTGVVHRPFYLDPVNRRVFARCSQAAYGMWKAYAADRGLPWNPVTTFEVATEPWMVERLEKYVHWGQENGMGPEEIELLTPQEVRRHEPNVSCHGAVWSKTDTAVDYEAFTQGLRQDAEREGAVFLTGAELTSIRPVAGELLELGVRSPRLEGTRVALDSRERVFAVPDWSQEPLRTRFLLNAAGGDSIDIAHLLGVGTQYTDLHFRGEYWVVDSRYRHLARRNIYTVARQPDLPFLDPHWIVRANGHVEIGPNAVPVPGPHTYRGLFDDPAQPFKKFFEKPIWNKIVLLFNPDFLTLAAGEWASSLSKRVMCGRARKFLPSLRVDYLVRPGIAGVRASVIDRRGNFIKEAIEFEGPLSYHITNYNSPGATGAPAYTAYILGKLAAAGRLDHLKPKAPGKGLWDFDAVVAAVGDAA
ncbi:MAG TPA: FAD-dependent oxidoreductase [Thermoplasmata archaeon]|jgi:L-2-hydroxyglutarate oxidase